MKALPENLSRVFLMREILETGNGEICKELKITTSNCWVVLYRARMRLQGCLQLKWFGDSVGVGARNENLQRSSRAMVIEGQDRSLGLLERIAVQVHLMMCSACRRFEAQMDFLRQAV